MAIIIIGRVLNVGLLLLEEMEALGERVMDGSEMGIEV